MKIKTKVKIDEVEAEVEVANVVILEVKTAEEIMVKREMKMTIATNILILQAGVEDKANQGHMEDKIKIEGMIEAKLNVIIVINLATILGNAEVELKKMSIT
ncbi:hypothetical protein ACOSQ3_006916 [Xanthoceras sorbifolium]